MGKGDRKTAKGKRNVSSYGNARPHSVVAVTKAVVTKKSSPAPKAAAKKTAAKKKA